MTEYRLLSWNVNGLRAVSGKDILPDTSFTEFLTKEKPDVLCLQETKADIQSLKQSVTRIPDYFFYINPAQRKGYSGVALYSRIEPEEVETGGLGHEFDHEGRIITARFTDFLLMNVYFPNGGASDERLAFKLRFYDAFLELVKRLDRDGVPLVICGDVNTAHTSIDLARPKENETVSGFLPEEREWIDRLIDSGFVDTFRLFQTEGGYYSWWDYKTRARLRNVGWRIDYFFVNERMRPYVSTAAIRADIMGSDHCPVTLTLIFPD